MDEEFGMTPRIDSYRFGEIVIDGVAYHKDVIILDNRVIENWWRAEGHRLSIHDLSEILDSKPTAIVIGTGAYGRMRVPDEIRGALKNAGCKVIIQRTKTACESFNQFRGPGIGAALHLTC